MNFDYIFQISTIIFGSTSILSGIVLWQSRKATIRLSEADSLIRTGEVYKFLTDITKAELAEMNEQINRLKNIISTQDIEISKLKLLQKEYELKCGDCLKTNK
jgi:hypothetical protein